MAETLDEIIEKFANHFDKNNILLKVAEECTELTEVLIKTVTKNDKLKPPTEKIVEEMGDVFFRAGILIKKLGLKEAVAERIKQKSESMNEWYKDRFEKQNK